MTQPTEGLAYALQGAEAASRDRFSAAGHTLEALATIAVVADGDYSVVTRTGPAGIPAEHRDRVADAAVKLADAIDLRVANLQTKLLRVERTACELAKLAAVARAGAPLTTVQERTLDHIDRLAELLELDVEAAA